MLSSMLKEHQANQAKKREEIGLSNIFRSKNTKFNQFSPIEQKRNAAIASSMKFSSELVHNLNEGLEILSQS